MNNTYKKMHDCSQYFYAFVHVFDTKSQNVNPLNIKDIKTTVFIVQFKMSLTLKYAIGAV